MKATTSRHCKYGENQSLRDTRFIFVEGIMGSGKTTTALFLAEQLQRHGIAAEFMSEGGPPRVALDLPHPNGIWLDVTIELYIEMSMQKWHAFTREAQRSGIVTACDGLLFHGNMTDLLLLNAEPGVLHRYVEQVIECIQSLQPVLIYFRRPDVAGALRVICDERGRASASWSINSARIPAAPSS